MFSSLQFLLHLSWAWLYSYSPRIWENKYQHCYKFEAHQDNKARSCLKNKAIAEEMAQQLRVPAALSEDFDLILSIYMVAHKHLNSSSRKSDTFFWPLWVPSVHALHRHTNRQNTHVHKVKVKNKVCFYKQDIKKMLKLL